MPWDGSGIYNPTNGVHTGVNLWQQAEAADRDIRADDMDGWVGDLKGALENTLTRDGQNAPTQDLPMNARKHTGVADATADDQYMAFGQRDPVVSDTEKTAGTETAHRRFSPDDVADMIDRHARVGTLADQASIAWDVQANPFGSATLRGNRRLANPTNAKEGGVYIFEAVQDATGNRTLAYGNQYSFGEEGTPVLSTGANKRDMLTFARRNGKMALLGISKGH